jgi:hypothetical protein
MVITTALRKSLHVYAVIGGACSNSAFRASLFQAYDPVNVDALRSVVNTFLQTAAGGDVAAFSPPTISDADLAKIWAFVAPRAVAAVPHPPLQVNPVQTLATHWNFEAACQAFGDSVCPHWPCDDQSA